MNVEKLAKNNLFARILFAYHVYCLQVERKSSGHRSRWPIPCSERKKETKIMGKGQNVSSSTASVRVYGEKEKKGVTDVMDCNRMMLKQVSKPDILD